MTQTAVPQILPTVSFNPQFSQVYSQGPSISQVSYSSLRVYQPSPPYTSFIPPTPIPRRMVYY